MLFAGGSPRRVACLRGFRAGARRRPTGRATTRTAPQRSGVSARTHGGPVQMDTPTQEDAGHTAQRRGTESLSMHVAYQVSRKTYRLFTITRTHSHSHARDVLDVVIIGVGHRFDFERVHLTQSEFRRLGAPTCRTDALSLRRTAMGLRYLEGA